MPEAFERFRKQGARIRRLTGPNKKYKVPAGYYRNIAIKGKGDNVKIAWGELHKKND